MYQTAHRLTKALAGKTVRRADLRHPRLATVDLAGRVFDGARSVGKHLFLRFGDVSLHCHLGMDGSWRLYAAGRRAPVNHRTRAILTTDAHTALGQSLLELKLVRTTDEGRLVAHLGPDLLDPDWTDDHAAEALRRLTADPAREVGLALLDQRVMAGVGNVYKTEICFLWDSLLPEYRPSTSDSVSNTKSSPTSNSDGLPKSPAAAPDAVVATRFCSYQAL